MKLKGLPLKKKVASLARTARDVGETLIRDGVVRSSYSTQERRLSICKGCNKFDGSICNACGCFAKFKAALEASRCPLDRW